MVSRGFFGDLPIPIHTSSILEQKKSLAPRAKKGVLDRQDHKSIDQLLGQTASRLVRETILEFMTFFILK